MFLAAAPDSVLSTRYDTADVIFVCQDGYALASARVRCYSFAKLLNSRGIRAEVLSFFDHLGATDACGPVSGIPDDEKLRLNLAAFDILRRNPRAVLYVQKTGYHTLSVALAAGQNGNPVVLDYDDYELDSQPYRRLEPWIPSLAPDALLATVARRARACVASSQRVFDIIRPMNPATHLIHTVADQDLFHPARRGEPRCRFGDAVNLLWCGDVWGDVPMKDILFGVDAFALMPGAVRAKARFHIIGFGRAWSELKARTRERHPALAEVVFHERIPPEEFGEVLAEMDVGVLPYARNDFNVGKSPTKMFEFLVSKVAVCATPVGEVTHCLEDGHSVLLAEGLEAFSAALARMIEDDTLRTRIAEEAFRTGMEHYTLRGIGDRLVDIIHGAMGPAADSTGPSIEEHMAHALGRKRPIAPREVVLARRDLATVLAAAQDLDTVSPRCWTEPLLALLQWPGLVGEGVGTELAKGIQQAGGRLRNAARLRPELKLPATQRPSGPPSLCKLAAIEDWEDEGWYGWADRFKTNYASFELNEVDTVADRDRLVAEDRLNHVYNYYKRSRGMWERVQYLYGLDRLGLLAGRRLLVVAEEIDGFYLLLTEFAERVDVLDIGPRSGDHARRAAIGETDLWLTRPRRYRRDRIVIHHGTMDHVPGGRWDAAIILGNTLMHGDTGGLLAWIDARVRPGGAIAFSVDIRLNDGSDAVGLAPALAGPDGLGTLLDGGTGWRPASAFDGSLSDATLDRLVDREDPFADNPHFVIRSGGTLLAPAVWIFHKDHDTFAGCWREMADRMRGPA